LHIQVEMVLTERSDTPFLIGIKSLLLVRERKEAVLVKQIDNILTGHRETESESWGALVYT
jgi:hypothetical protein